MSWSVQEMLGTNHDEQGDATGGTNILPRLTILRNYLYKDKCDSMDSLLSITREQ